MSTTGVCDCHHPPLESLTAMSSLRSAPTIATEITHLSEDRLCVASSVLNHAITRLEKDLNSRRTHLVTEDCLSNSKAL